MPVDHNNTQDGLLTGYSDENRKEILSTLFHALMMIDDKKENVTDKGATDENLHHALHFFGALVQCAPDYEQEEDDNDNDEAFNIFDTSTWQPKQSLCDMIERELLTPSHKDDDGIMDSSTSSKNYLNTTATTPGNNSNIPSFGASTISTRQTISNNTSIISNDTLCHTIVIITTILQKIAIELELLCSDSESMANSDYICRLYVQ